MTFPDTEKQAHSILGPSSSNRWLKCPGSVRLSNQIPENEFPPVHPAAMEGTIAHEILADRLGEGRFVANHEDDEISDSVDLALSYVKETIDGYNDTYGECEMLVEEYCSLEFLGIKGMEGGTTDIALLGRDMVGELQCLEVVDFKHGKGTYVEAENNSQLLMYSIALAEKYHATDDTKILLTIIQPRYFGGGSKIRTWEVDLKTLLEWRESDLVPRATRCMEPDAPLVYDVNTCQYCPAKNMCPALAEMTQELAKQDYTSISSEDEIRGLPLEIKKKILEASLILPSFIESVKQVCQEEMLDGSTAYNETHKLVKKVSHKRWTNDAEATLFTKIPQKLLYKKVMQSASQIQAALTEKYGKDKAQEILGQVQFVPKASLVIAPISDRRKPMGADETAQIDFADIAIEEEN